MTWAADIVGVAAAHNIPPDLILNDDPAVALFARRALTAAVNERHQHRRELAILTINALAEALDG